VQKHIEGKKEKECARSKNRCIRGRNVFLGGRGEVIGFRALCSPNTKADGFVYCAEIVQNTALM
jgi:hypothetical protein